MRIKFTLRPPGIPHDDVMARFHALQERMTSLEEIAGHGHRATAGFDMATFRLDEQIDHAQEEMLAIAWELVERPNTTANILAKAEVIRIFGSEEGDDIVHVAARSLAQAVVQMCSLRSKCGET